ncbi:MAG: hypothetical protein Q9219_006904 [cf. Caloplaca sp. 3 TL-2023]
MILQGRALARLSHHSTQCLDKRATLSLAINITRVSSFQQPYHENEVICPIRPTFSASLPFRHYATKAVSRPKAHTGRTTNAPRKKASTAKASTAKAPTAGSEGAAAKPAAVKPKAKKAGAKKRKTKAKSKSKPRTRAKSTKARKKPARTRTPKLTPEQKTSKLIKELKEKALSPPKGLPATAFAVLLSETSKNPTTAGQAGSAIAKECSAKYRSFSPQERENYNHTANQNKIINKAKYQEWIRSFTPTQIREANNARNTLRRRAKGRWFRLHDERLVKRPASPYTCFVTGRFRSGDFAGLAVTEAAKLMATEWRALSVDEKKASRHGILTKNGVANHVSVYRNMSSVLRRTLPGTSKKSKPSTTEM